MNGWAFLLIVAAGGLGAGLRYVLDLAVTALLGSRFPWGTFVVNVLGSFALGVVVGAVPDASWAEVLGVGLLGGFTTFSSVSSVSAVLLTDGRRIAGLANAFGTLAATAAAAGLGLILGTITVV